MPGYSDAAGGQTKPCWGRVPQHYPYVHHHDVVADVAHHAQVVGDGHVRHAPFCLQIHEQIKDLGLDGYIQAETDSSHTMNLGSTASARASPTSAAAHRPAHGDTCSHSGWANRTHPSARSPFYASLPALTSLLTFKGSAIMSLMERRG